MRCDHCGEAIGAYEPLVLILRGEAQRTSLAANPDARAIDAEERYHGSCYELRSADR